MLYGNQLEVELLKTGLIDKRRPPKRPSKKKFKCVKCGAPMIRVNETNVMACSSCKNWFIFTN